MFQQVSLIPTRWGRRAACFIQICWCTRYRYVKIAIENGDLWWIVPLKIVISHSYVAVDQRVFICWLSTNIYVQKMPWISSICCLKSPWNPSLSYVNWVSSSGGREPKNPKIHLQTSRFTGEPHPHLGWSSNTCSQYQLVGGRYIFQRYITPIYSNILQ